MKILQILILLPIVVFSQTKIYVDPATQIKMAITEYNDVPIIKIKPGQNTKFILKKDVNFAPNAILVDVPRDSTVHYEVRMEVIVVPETTQPPVIIEDRIDDDNTALTYNGTWIRAFKGPGTSTATMWYNSPWTDLFLNDNLTLTQTLNTYVEYTFTGNKIEIIGEKRENHGLIKVTIDGVDKPLIDTYENTKENKPSVLYSESFAQGSHKIRVTFHSYDATKVPTRNSIVLDGFKVYKAQ